MTNDLELRLEGDIVTTGGLLIVDPHWIHDLDTSLKGLKETNRTCKEQPPSITENTQNAIRRAHELQERLSRELLEVKDERIVIELMQQYIALQEQERKKARIGELQEGPFRAPPFLSRGNGYVTFWCIIEDARLQSFKKKTIFQYMFSTQSIDQKIKNFII